mgnify:CR=1 FL=1
MKVLANTLLALGVLFFASVKGGAKNMNTDSNHGHEAEYFNNLKYKYRNDRTYVHLIPHSHDDVGWLKTVDEYFSGTQE